VKVCVPQAAIAGFDHGGRRYFARDGHIDVPDDVGRHLIRHDECFAPSNQPRGAAGFVCASCSFHGFFRICGRCGGEAHRPGENPATATTTPTTQEV